MEKRIAHQIARTLSAPLWNIHQARLATTYEEKSIQYGAARLSLNHYEGFVDCLFTNNFITTEEYKRLNAKRYTLNTLTYEELRKTY